MKRSLERYRPGDGISYCLSFRLIHVTLLLLFLFCGHDQCSDGSGGGRACGEGGRRWTASFLHRRHSHSFKLASPLSCCCYAEGVIRVVVVMVMLSLIHI